MWQLNVFFAAALRNLQPPPTSTLLEFIKAYGTLMSVIASMEDMSSDEALSHRSYLERIRQAVGVLNQLPNDFIPRYADYDHYLATCENLKGCDLFYDSSELLDWCSDFVNLFINTLEGENGVGN